ncbi:MAG TPA: hypothetical protein VLC54_06970 [Anaeromyxobacter sp.]|nr:hypothetical protein [Anaeromyxobacter sp.]
MSLSRRSPEGQLPKNAAARAGTIAALVIGGVVALLVPVFFAIMLFGLLK